VTSEDAIIDLLGVLAYGELSAFDRLSDDARMAQKAMRCSQET